MSIKNILNIHRLLIKSIFLNVKAENFNDQKADNVIFLSNFQMNVFNNEHFLTETTFSTRSFPLNKNLLDWYQSEKSAYISEKKIKDRKLLSFKQVDSKMKERKSCQFRSKCIILNFVKFNSDKYITSCKVCSICFNQLDAMYCAKCSKFMDNFETVHFIQIHLFDVLSKSKIIAKMYDNLISMLFERPIKELTNTQNHVRYLLIISIKIVIYK